MVSALATNLLKFSAPLMANTPFITCSPAKIRIIENTTSPTTLNIKCINAALLAFLLADIAAITAGVHEPIFAPKIKKRHGNGSTSPAPAKRTRTLTVTDELCNIVVTINAVITAITGLLSASNNTSN